MIYKVKAQFNFDKSEEFYKKLIDGTIQNQKPDGYEIVNAMKRATIDSEGWVKWTELCYCPTPLFHERKTVYDAYFSSIETQSIDHYETYEGRSFMQEISNLGKEAT